MTVREEARQLAADAEKYAADARKTLRFKLTPENVETAKVRLRGAISAAEAALKVLAQDANAGQ
jgi:hypothetical protein